MNQSITNQYWIFKASSSTLEWNNLTMVEITKENSNYKETCPIRKNHTNESYTELWAAI